MARKKKDKGQTTTDSDEVVALTRIEERIEYVALTDAEKCERLESCAGIESSIGEVERKHALIADEAKALKAEIEVKCDELRRAVREAHEGTKGAAYPVLVERHPDHPAEMIVWRCPDGVEAKDIVHGMMADGSHIAEATIAAREAQGCVLVETRAMTGEELRAAKPEDWRAKNPELPFPESTVVEGANGGASVIVFEGGKKDSVEEPVSGDNGSAAPAKGTPLCPFVLVEGADATSDQVCGRFGVRRHRGFCPEHVEALGGAEKLHDKEVMRMLARRQARKDAAAQAALAATVEQPSADDTL